MLKFTFGGLLSRHTPLGLDWTVIYPGGAAQFLLPLPLHLLRA
jgi:hypothetical protein